MFSLQLNTIQRRRAWLSALASGLLLAAGPPAISAPAESPAVVAADAPAALSDSDQKFLVAAAGAFHYQREAARLAVKRSKDPLVKAHAALLIEQHGQACQELRQMVQARKLPTHEGAPADRRVLLDALAAVPVGTFDRHYIEQVSITQLQADLGMVRLASHSLSDAALRAWAQRMTQVMQLQLASARSLPARAVAQT